MEHPANNEEFEILSQMDFIVPLKQFGVITRAVLEAIHRFYRPRRIVVVTAQKEERIFNLVIRHWAVGKVEFIAEETFFQPGLNLSLDRIMSEYDFNRGDEQREPGWWIQQLIKLGAATQIPNISQHYVVWDGDLVPLRRWRLCARNGTTGTVDYYIAVLQGKSRSEFNTIQYAGCMQALTEFEPLEPSEGGTFVAHHMVFSRKHTLELLDLMVKTAGLNLPWPLVIMSYSRKFYRFSEYKTYSTFMLRKYPEEFHYHPLDAFGEGGLRFRDASEVAKEMMEVCKVSYAGLTYAQVRKYTLEHILPKEGVTLIPGYVQLDHVYGLEQLIGDKINALAPAKLSAGNKKSAADMTYMAALLGTNYTTQTSRLLSPTLRAARLRAIKASAMSVAPPPSTTKFPSSPSSIIAVSPRDENEDHQATKSGSSAMKRRSITKAEASDLQSSTKDNLFVRVPVDKIRLKRPWVCAK